MVWIPLQPPFFTVLVVLAGILSRRQGNCSTRAAYWFINLNRTSNFASFEGT
ncbi:MAG: hypothetical protein LBP69_10065 [Treponema sp.]|nr:hypothetical protein [Treponema sp.]